jgi:hypothetical protein
MSLLPAVQRFVRDVPKVELHLHLVGSASPATVSRLADRHGSAVVPVDQTALRSFFEFTDFLHFIEVYIAVNALVTTGEDIADLVDGSAADLAAQNVRYAEMTITPFSHLSAASHTAMCSKALPKDVGAPRLAACRSHGSTTSRGRWVDPSWTPLFLPAAAVVCDAGAVQSHAAIVARELGIPAVLSVPGITAVADGTTLHVDGDCGTVRVGETAVRRR